MVSAETHDCSSTDSGVFNPKQGTHNIYSKTQNCVVEGCNEYRKHKMRRTAGNAVFWTQYTEPLQQWFIDNIYNYLHKTGSLIHNIRVSEGLKRTILHSAEL